MDELLKIKFLADSGMGLIEHLLVLFQPLPLPTETARDKEIIERYYPLARQEICLNLFVQLIFVFFGYPMILSRDLLGSEAFCLCVIWLT